MIYTQDDVRKKLKKAIYLLKENYKYIVIDNYDDICDDEINEFSREHSLKLLDEKKDEINDLIKFYNSTFKDGINTF